jgi:hypothetical protein
LWLNLPQTPIKTEATPAMLDVSKWPMFSVLDQSEVQAIKKICVFGSSGNEAVYINEEDDAYKRKYEIKKSCFVYNL